MHRASVTVEALVGIGVEADVVDHEHARVLKPHPYVAGEIEHRVTGALAGQEETDVLGIRIEEALDEFAAYLVGGLADQWADRGDDAAAVGAEFLHRID